MTAPIESFNSGGIRVVVESFGYLHGPPPDVDITVDVRKVARDPHINPALREMTGLDRKVQDQVLCVPDVLSVIQGLYELVAAFIPVKSREGLLVWVGVGCSGGRHRSVVIANELVRQLGVAGVGADVTHRDILKPVVTR